MALPAPYESCCELPKRSARFGSQEWTIPRKFRVITQLAYPIPGPATIVACPDIPALGTSYWDFATGETIPNAILMDYEAEEQSNPREWIVTCTYTTQQRAPQNAGGLQSPPTPSRPQSGGAGSNPDDPTALLPQAWDGTELVRIPYREDPQDDAAWTFSNGVPLLGSFTNYTNSAGERFASSATQEVLLKTYHIKLYLAEYTNYDAVSNRVNMNEWDGAAAKSMYLKPVRQKRERFGNRWFWLNEFDFLHDPRFFHRFTVLNAGFRELTAPRPADQAGVRTLRDITVNGQKTAVEWPLDVNGTKISDPGLDGVNLVYARFNKYFASSVFEDVIPFLLTDFGFIL